MARVLDFVFFLYFASHIPVTIFIDSQAIFPSSYFPDQVVALKDWYCREFRDPMMVEPPQWFLSFIYCEIIFQFPFFFVAAYAYFKGAAKCKWLRLPAAVYGSHVATTVIAIAYHVFTHDFSTSKHPGPRDLKERSTLFAIYSPYLLVPLLLMLDTMFSAAYRPAPSGYNASNKKRR
ncbi:sigma intracellular receptor 2-like isoform X1 [Haliotis rubra]|uniref:sigma intracellular receptor 2-like isoform X1 n=1 Tax=Haliotis rubra TaxID=36100 RepID=UPI001EE5FAB0|nr:sigma intracellular receptor 2-like isoform X1 [Haliotis rubra]